MTQGTNHIYCAKCGRKIGFRQGRKSFMTKPFRPLPKFVVNTYGGNVEHFLRMPVAPVCETCP